jgi:hypothetical protein
MFARGLRGRGRTDRRGDGGLVDGGRAGEERRRVRRQFLEAPPRGSDPATLTRQRDLLDALGHVDRMATADQAEDRQRARWFVRVRALQHEDRTVVREPPHLRDQTRRSRRMQVERMVGGISGDHGRVGAEGPGPVDRSAEATVRLSQRPGAEVQVGEVCDAHRVALPHVAERSSVSSLSR